MARRLLAPIALLFLVTPAWAQANAKLKQELRSRETAAKKDADKLFEVAKWAKTQKLQEDATRIMTAVLKLNPDHRATHEALGNVQHEGKWMTAKEAENLQKKKEEKGSKKALRPGFEGKKTDFINNASSNSRPKN